MKDYSKIKSVLHSLEDQTEVLYKLKEKTENDLNRFLPGKRRIKRVLDNR